MINTSRRVQSPIRYCLMTSLFKEPTVRPLGGCLKRPWSTVRFDKLNDRSSSTLTLSLPKGAFGSPFLVRQPRSKWYSTTNGADSQGASASFPHWAIWFITWRKQTKPNGNFLLTPRFYHLTCFASLIHSWIMQPKTTRAHQPENCSYTSPSIAVCRTTHRKTNKSRAERISCWATGGIQARCLESMQN